MKKYFSILLLLFCSCAFVYHADGNEEKWAKAYKISKENIEKKAWDKIKLDGQYFAVFKKNYFIKEGFKSKNNSVVILSSMYNFPSDSEEKIDYDEKHGNTINSIPCIIIVNNIEINTANNKDFKERISKLKIITKENNYKFLGYIKPFQLKENMFYIHDEEFAVFYNKNKDILSDKSIRTNIFKEKTTDELNKILIEKGYNRYIKEPIRSDDIIPLSIMFSIILQSEKYYQLGYKYPCFECTLK